MYLGVVTAAFASQPLDEALDAILARGISAVEVPAGGYFPRTHCDPERLLAEPSALAHFRDAIARRELTLTALALHGNPVHPNPDRRAAYAREYQYTCELAERLGLTRLTLLAGLPGGGPEERTPNWIVHPFPPELESMLRWQWDECLLPHWQKAAKIAENHGLRLCFEMVPADCVYHPRALLRLRAELGPVIGCNFDPSHLFMQGIDPIETIHVLADAIYHVHAKDARLEPRVVRVDGVLDTLPYSSIRERAWIYRTVGYGNGEGFWRDFISALRVIGYDDVVSIEHEDALFAADEGLRKAVEVLQRVMPFAPLDDAGWWAVDATS